MLPVLLDDVNGVTDVIDCGSEFDEFDEFDTIFAFSSV